MVHTGSQCIVARGHVNIAMGTACVSKKDKLIPSAFTNLE